MLRSTMRNRCAHGGMRCVRFSSSSSSSSSFAHSCGPPPHHPADLYISRRVSHFCHYHFCRGGVRTRHTRPANPSSSSCRVHVETGSCDPSTRTRVFVCPLRVSNPLPFRTVHSLIETVHSDAVFFLTL